MKSLKNMSKNELIELIEMISIENTDLEDDVRDVNIKKSTSSINCENEYNERKKEVYGLRSFMKEYNLYK